MRNGIPILLFLLVCVVGFLLAPTIGSAWDEPDNIVSAGRYILFFQKKFDPHILFNPNWKVSYFDDKIYTQNPEITRYPPVPNYLGALLTLASEKVGIPLTGRSMIVAFHFATVLFLALLVVTVYAFGRLFGLSTVVSAFAAVTAFLYPTIFGHGFSNLKDTAQMSLFAVSLYFLVKGTVRRTRRDILFGAIIWGLALASKFNAVFVPIIWGIWRFTIYDLRFTNKKALISFITSLFLVLFVGLLTTFLVWPVLWFDPLKHGAEVLHYFTTIGQGYKVYWNGILYEAGQGNKLWWYPWVNILFITPPILLVSMLMGVGKWVIDILKKRKESYFGSLLILWICIPLGRSLVPGVAFYDGIRHFMESLPALILLAAYGLSLVSTTKVFRVGAFVLGVAIVAHLLYINTLYFPYSTGYLTLFAHDPNTNFDRDIEGLSVKEAADYVKAHFAHPTIAVPIAGHLSWYYLPEDSQFVYTVGRADTIILINKMSHILSTLPGQLDLTGFTKVYTIERGTSVFGWVYRKQ